MNENRDLYGAERLVAALGNIERTTPAAVIGVVREDVRRFTGNAEQSDDLTMLCVQRSGPS